jgi:hypothetical protein
MHPLLRHNSAPEGVRVAPGAVWAVRPVGVQEGALVDRVGRRVGQLLCPLALAIGGGLGQGLVAVDAVMQALIGPAGFDVLLAAAASPLPCSSVRSNWVSGHAARLVQEQLSFDRGTESGQGALQRAVRVNGWCLYEIYNFLVLCSGQIFGLS